MVSFLDGNHLDVILVTYLIMRTIVKVFPGRWGSVKL